MVSGLVLIDKPSGMSSFRCLQEAKKRLGVRKAGYLGTLDPLATGLLACFLEDGTRLIRHFSEVDKEYEVCFELGKETDTFDRLGTVQHVLDLWKTFSEDDLMAVIKRRQGTLQQVQPHFSAIRTNGKRAYERARAGEVFNLGTRTVTIYKVEMLSVRLPIVCCRITCSSGTYVRSWVHEVGADLGCGAMLTELRRTGVGPWTVDDAVPIGKLSVSHLLSLDMIRISWLSHVK